MRREHQHLSDYAAGGAVLEEVIEAGIYDWQGGIGFEQAAIPASLFALAEDEFEETGTKNTARSDSSGINPNSLHFRDRSVGRMVHPGLEPPYAQWTVELARFHVPAGGVGVVKGFEQYLAQQEEGFNPAFVYTDQSRWGIPGPWNTGTVTPIADSGVWHFRLHYVHNALPPLVNATGNTPLPDVAYPDYPFESNLWYPAGSPSCGNIHLLVPGNTCLRLFYVTPVQDFRLEVAAKLKGFVQSDRSEQARENIRTNY